MPTPLKIIQFVPTGCANLTPIELLIRIRVVEDLLMFIATVPLGIKLTFSAEAVRLQEFNTTGCGFAEVI